MQQYNFYWLLFCQLPVKDIVKCIHKYQGFRIAGIHSHVFSGISRKRKTGIYSRQYYTLKQTQFSYSILNNVRKKFGWNFFFINAEFSHWFPHWRVIRDYVQLVGNLSTSANILDVKVSKDIAQDFVRERQTFKFGVHRSNCGWFNHACTQYFIWLVYVPNSSIIKWLENCSNFLRHINNCYLHINFSL